MPPATDLPPGKRGRPRSAEADAAILAAAYELLTEVGIVRLAMDDVATRAGVSKATIYRRWASKEAMILDALTARIVDYELADTGSLRGDLAALVQTAIERARRGTTRELMPHLIAAATSDPKLQPALDTYVATRALPVSELIDRAILRGELDARTDVELAIDLVLGPLTHRRLFYGEVYDAARAERLVDSVLAALTGGAARH